jgi:UPF0716 protein FxsA
MLYLVLLFTVVPAVELFLLLQLGSVLGALETFLIVVLTGTVGAWLAKREGFGVLTSLREELAEGIPPGSRIAEGVLVLVGGILLVTPGVLTDLTGFALIFPWTRRWIAPRLTRALLARVDVRLGGVGNAPAQPDGPDGVRPRRPRPRRVEQEGSPFASPFDDLP